jgi:hypothetical protein
MHVEPSGGEGHTSISSFCTVLREARIRKWRSSREHSSFSVMPICSSGASRRNIRACGVILRVTLATRPYSLGGGTRGNTAPCARCSK